MHRMQTCFEMVLGAVVIIKLTLRKKFNKSLTGSLVFKDCFFYQTHKAIGNLLAAWRVWSVNT